MKLLITILLLISFNCLSQGQSIGSYGYKIIPSKLVGFDTDLFLPDTIYLAQGNSARIYNENVSYIPSKKHGRCTFDWVTEIGNITDSCLNIKAVSLGNYDIKCYAVNSAGAKVDSVSSVVKVETKVVIGAKIGLLIGDSQTALGISPYQSNMNDSINIVLSLIGTQGTAPNLSEGRGGWYYQSFLINGSPFYIGGQFNISQYLINNAFATPDFIRISAGVNECFVQTTPATAIGYATTLIDSILSQLPNVQIILNQPINSCDTYLGWMSSYKTIYTTEFYYEKYVKCIRELNDSIESKFAYGRYNERVNVAPGTLFINRNWDFPKTNGIHSNALHPSWPGYRNDIIGTYNLINHIFQ